MKAKNVEYILGDAWAHANEARLLLWNYGFLTDDESNEIAARLIEFRHHVQPEILNSVSGLLSAKPSGM